MVTCRTVIRPVWVGPVGLGSNPLVVAWRPVWFSGRCAPATGRGEVRQDLGGTSNYRPGVIGAMKERPAPEGHRRSDRPAGQGRRHRLRVALWRLEHWPPQTGHVVEECWPGNTPVVDFGHRRLVRRGEGRGISV